MHCNIIQRPEINEKEKNIKHFGVIYKYIYKPCKVYIFWEGHKILRNLHLRFDRYYILRTNLRWEFRKILWPSQNIWTLNLVKTFLKKIEHTPRNYCSILLIDIMPGPQNVPKLIFIWEYKFKSNYFLWKYLRKVLVKNLEEFQI